MPLSSAIFAPAKNVPPRPALPPHNSIPPVHFWGPAANWGLVLAAMLDMNKPPEAISLNITGVLTVYSMLFMRFAWMVKPRNYLLLSCHASNTVAQSVQLSRRLTYDGWLPQGLVPEAVMNGGAPGAPVPAPEHK